MVGRTEFELYCRTRTRKRESWGLDCPVEGFVFNLEVSGSYDLARFHSWKNFWLQWEGIWGWEEGAQLLGVGTIIIVWLADDRAWLILKPPSWFGKPLYCNLTLASNQSVMSLGDTPPRAPMGV
jgi:hypothetical protein